VDGFVHTDFQLLCTNPSTVNYTLTKLRQFYITLERAETIICHKSAFPDDGPARTATCRRWCIPTLFWFWRNVCIFWIKLW